MYDIGSFDIPKVNLARLKTLYKWADYSPRFYRFDPDMKSERNDDEVEKQYLNTFFRFIERVDGDIDYTSTEYLLKGPIDDDDKHWYCAVVQLLSAGYDSSVMHYGELKLTEEEKKLANSIIVRYDGTNYEELMNVGTTHPFFVESYVNAILCSITNLENFVSKESVKSIGTYPTDN